MYTRSCILLALCAAFPASCFADFRYDESTRITGGAAVSMAKFAGAFSKQARQITDPITSTILVKGNRLAHVNKDTTEIIDLDKETITHVDHAKKQYTVITFEEMKAAQEEAIQKAQQQSQQQPQASTPPANTDTPPAPELKFKVSVTNTGASKDVAGLAASETILKMSVEPKDKDKEKDQNGQTGNIAMTNDMWMAPEIPGYGEIRDFYVRMASKMGTVFRGTLPSLMAAQLPATQPGMFSGMGDMVKEMSKLKGVPVSQTMRVGTTADGSPLPAASEAPLPESNTPSAGSIANKAAAGAATSATDTAASSAENKAASRMGNFGGIASGLGGLGGFHKKKQKTEEPAPAPAAAADASPQSAVLIESTTEMTGFSSTPIDTALFGVPVAYSKVPSEYQKAHQ